MAIANYFSTYHELVLQRILAGLTKLYPHQREALLSIYQKAMRGEMNSIPRQAALILCGVGTGKTLIQALTPFILAPWMSAEKVLFLSDNCTLRSRFIKDFPTTAQGRPIYDQWLLYSLEILPPGVPPPTIVELDANNFESYAFALHSASMLVANRQFLLNLVTRGDIEPTSIGLIVVDEAHFSAAQSYRTIVNYFESSLLTYFTGSKFRSDSQPLPNVHYSQIADLDELGNTVIRYAPDADYEFSLQQAWRMDPPPIKKLTLSEASSKAFVIEENGEEIAYDFETFINRARSDRQWFRQILLADSFCLPVLQKAVEVLLSKRSATGQPHAMIVRALNIAHVHRVAKLLEDNFPVLEGKVGVIHSEHDEYDLAGRASEILQRFYRGDLWVLVHCGMIGVGFDHPWASVSCCLCVLKSLSPAEQEWGRIIRRVPGEAAGKFPNLTHPNWGVIVTHESLGIYSLFQEFLKGKESDAISQTNLIKKTKPALTCPYEAGETVLTINEVGDLKPGDVLQLTAIIEPSSSAPPKFNLAAELGSLTQAAPEIINLEDDVPNDAAMIDSNAHSGLERLPLFYGVDGPDTVYKEQPLPKEAEVKMITERLQEIRTTRTVNVCVEAVLNDHQVQITPTWIDLPQGATVQKSRSLKELEEVSFIEHLGLDWQVWVDNKLVSFAEYKKSVLLQQKGLELNESGDICANGISLKQTMAAAVYETFLKGIEAELANFEVEIPHAGNVIVRPDVAKMNLQNQYGAKVRALVQDIFKQRHLVPDGPSGTSLIKGPVKLLSDAIERVTANGYEADFKNNSQLIHAALFGYIKEKTGRSWSEHNEQQYKEAWQLGWSFIRQLIEQLRWRKRIIVNRPVVVDSEELEF
ncbi:DEAD/DEAH box helicase [Gloeothece verrucosa]|uniref:Type III restriction protein res subunit n=1 Tax=Gloeothece verrucosa (strain PCC 7822) TaxID=497965 RepID=E0UMT0_GLOV7|nr:DEAD/DEAH box helicase family protein [Gloeothece verrucosa]ADN18260.1 type III restriction protein res subunit [Gloeothece verrucosa PCC 7822]